MTVGTVDQLLVPLFHAGRWALKEFAAADSAIVIDEVHAYEPHTLGLIVTMIRQLRHWEPVFSSIERDDAIESACCHARGPWWR